MSDINPKRYDGGDTKKITQKRQVCDAKSGKRKSFPLSLLYSLCGKEPWAEIHQFYNGTVFVNYKFSLKK